MGKKDARIEVRIPFDGKELLKKRLDSEGYDTISDYVRDKIFTENISQAPVIFEFDETNIIAAIEKNRSILVQLLHNQERAQQLQPIKNIVDSLMSLVSLEDMKKCRTI